MGTPAIPSTMLREAETIAVPSAHRVSAAGGRPLISFGRELLGVPSEAESREWLVTNGLGSYASGTIAGLHTRRYHGLLVAALKPPLGRTLLVTKFEETILYDGKEYRLSSNHWEGGATDLEGTRHIEEFHLEGSTPVWTFSVADLLLEKRLWMKQGEDTTYVRYRLLRAGGQARFAVNAFVNYREFHSQTRAGAWEMEVRRVGHGVCVRAFAGARPFYLLTPDASLEPAHTWYRNYAYAAEAFRGLPDVEDHLLAARCSLELAPGGAVTFIASLREDPSLDAADELRTRMRYETERKAEVRHPAGAAVADTAVPDALCLAADQFIVERATAEGPGKSIIAGYHWFGDWGRDTMISLPGLTLSTGRVDVARSILRTFARFVDRGMLPNRFPDEGETPEYNTADATLWYVEAIRQYVAVTGDEALLRELYPVLREIISWHIKGTRYRIEVDPSDGLLHAGEAGVQLTWMDAKIGDWVVTPRIGKPVEVNALWYNALQAMATFADRAGDAPDEFKRMAARAAAGFRRFWNGPGGYCFDVIDGPDGDDASMRPNQIFAVSLPHSPLSGEQQRAVVDACGRRLLTSHGLRSLSPDDARYVGRYGGDQFRRDSAYHQGTVWGWLLGPFALAHFRVHGDAATARSFLEPMAHHLRSHGIGSLSEIFDADPPHAPRGCIAQAWTVAEVLRAWVETGKGSSVGR